MYFRSLFFVLVFFLSAGVACGQGKLVSVRAERDLTLEQGIDSVFCEFGRDIREKDASRIFGILKRSKQRIHCASIEYQTVDPAGNEIVASGLITYPERRKPFRGVIEVSPYNREKSQAGSLRMYTTEALISVLGYVMLIPDTIGYGATDSLTIPYVFTDNAVRVSSDMRLAAAEYFRRKEKEFPRETYLFGYSLGSPTALALAYFYRDHPAYGVKLKGLCLGSGAYDPLLALDRTLETGRMGYIIYPGIIHGIDAWGKAELNASNLFIGPVLRDIDLVSGGTVSYKTLTEQYGTDLHAYLSPDFFSPAGNEDVARLRHALSEVAYPCGHEAFPASVKVVMRHSRTDDIVPVDCSDELYGYLKGLFRNVVYHRDRKGTHYEVAVRSFIDLALMIL